MCDCSTCNMTKEEHEKFEEEYLMWQYGKYCETTKKPLSIEYWLKNEQSEKR